MYNIKIRENQLNKIKIQEDEIEEVKLFSIKEIEKIIDRGDKQFHFPQNSEIAINLIKANKSL